jgi:uncharacterized coiled-coil protein SlyX
MQNELKDLIFSNNSTLLATLSELDVTDLASNIAQTEKNTADLINLKSEIDSLGLTLSRYQADTNANFATVNQRISEQDAVISGLSVQISDLSELIDHMATRLDQQDLKINKLAIDVENNNTLVNNLSISVSRLASDVEDLETLVNGFDARITSNSTAIDSLRVFTRRLEEDLNSTDAKLVGWYPYGQASLGVFTNNTYMLDMDTGIYHMTVIEPNYQPVLVSGIGSGEGIVYQTIRIKSGSETIDTRGYFQVLSSGSTSLRPSYGGVVPCNVRISIVLVENGSSVRHNAVIHGTFVPKPLNKDE